MATITERASMRWPLLDRICCARCGHLHRRVMRHKCDCCRVDFEDVYRPDRDREES